jgi:hypothetical protein
MKIDIVLTVTSMVAKLKRQYMLPFLLLGYFVLFGFVGLELRRLKMESKS